MKKIIFLLTVLAGVAGAETNLLPTGGPGWSGDPTVWKFLPDGVHCQSSRGNGIAVYEAAPLASNVTVEACFTPRKVQSTGWAVAAIAIVEDERNFWHLALGQSPPGNGSKPFVELQEMRDGKWLSTSNLKIESNETSNVNWVFGQPHILKLSLDTKGITGTIMAPDGTQIMRQRYRFTGAAVTRGRPALHIDGITGEFTKIHAGWSETDPIGKTEKVFPPYTVGNVVPEIQDVATGFFRVVQKPDGRWWTIDPLGRGIVLLGVDHVTFQGHGCEKLGYHPYGRKNSKKYSDCSAWEQETLERLKTWGFTMLGAGCDPTLNHRGLAHTGFLNIGSYLSELGDEFDITPNEQRPCSAFPNVFHPDFEAFCHYRARQFCAPNRNDPWLVGYFIDNELAWWGRDEPWRNGHLATGLFDAVMKKGAAHSAKIALRVFLAQQAGNDLPTFNGRWGTQLKSFDEILALSTLPSANEAQRTVKRDFLRFVAERYFSITTRAIREADPNHLVLGARFAGTGGADPVVWEVAGKYCDVVTFNCYPMVDMNEGHVYTQLDKTGELVTDHFAKFYNTVKRPMIITEWSFPALDAGLPSMNGAGQRFRTQTERTAATSLFARTMLSLPFLIGYDYFMWVDEPALGISTPFPEDSNYGLVNEEGVPYVLLTDMFTALHREAGAWRFKPAPQAHPKATVLPDAMNVARKAASAGKAKAFYVQEGDAFRAGNGQIKLSGQQGNGNMVRRVTFVGKDERSFGQYNALIQTLDGEGRNRWTDTLTVKTVDGRMIDGLAVVDVTSTTRDEKESFEVTHRLILPPGTPWFISELVGVKNVGTKPLRLTGLYFRVYGEFKGASEKLPPNLWGMPEAACWLDEADGRFFGTVASKAPGMRVNFWVDTLHGGVTHPDARLEIEETAVAPGATYKPAKPLFVICVVGRGGNELWWKTAQDLKIVLEPVE